MSHCVDPHAITAQRSLELNMVLRLTFRDCSENLGRRIGTTGIAGMDPRATAVLNRSTDGSASANHDRSPAPDSTTTSYPSVTRSVMVPGRGDARLR